MRIWCKVKEAYKRLKPKKKRHIIKLNINNNNYGKIMEVRNEAK